MVLFCIKFYNSEVKNNLNVFVFKMSSALIRQALEFVDPEEGKIKRNKKRSAVRKVQDTTLSFKPKRQSKKQKIQKESDSSDKIVEENVKKLLALSQPTSDTALAEKIIQRAVKGKPLLEKIEVKKEEEKSILFPGEESFTKFEKEYFCS